jgi:hypothetical protein
MLYKIHSLTLGNYNKLEITLSHRVCYDYQQVLIIKETYNQHFFKRFKSNSCSILSQPLLVSLNYVGNFSILPKVTNTNTSHFAMLMVSSPDHNPLSIQNRDQPS